MKLITLDKLGTFLDNLKNLFATKTDLDNKVDKVSGKGLSTNDYTTAEKTKLSGVANGAQVNTIESIKVNGTALTPSSKAVNIDLSEYATNSSLSGYAKKSDISGVYIYKGSVKTYSALPTSGQKAGDVYNVEGADSSHGVKAGDNVAWNGTAWDVLAGTVDLSGYATTASLSNKVDKVSGKGLSTNDYTSAEKTKLAGIATSAQVNVIETIKVNGSALSVSNKAVNISVPDVTECTDAEINALFTS